MVDYLLADPREVILCTALTNRAVDEICSALEHLWNDGLLLRLGSLDATEHDAISFARSAQTQDFAELASQLQRARVIVATVPYLNANLHLFSLIAPTTAIVDEAAQLLEPHLLALAVRVERMVMIGDVCQLPAVVEQDERGCRVQHPLLEAIGVERLDRSLFERLLRLAKRNHWTHAYGRLIEQARMHHLIARFPGTQFYGTIFRSMHRWQDEAPDVLPIEMLPKLLRHRLVFVDTPRESASGYNRSEAQIAAACTRALVKACHDRSPSQAIGIVTPFRKQIRTIAELLGDLSQQVTIDTVERFQGSERDHIIVSCAVNSRQHLRRIESPTELDGRTIDRKLNVALTRARHQVIIIGNRQILELSPHYAAFVGFIEQHGLVVSAAEAMRALSPFLTSHENLTHHWH
jgi:DNA replication ATP-dependent helicase Dna2